MSGQLVNMQSTDILDLVYGAANPQSLSVVVSYVDIDNTTFDPSKTDREAAVLTNTAGATATILTAPASGKTRAPQSVWVKNDSTVAVDVTPRLNISSGGTIIEYPTQTLQPQWALEWLPDIGWFVYKPAADDQRLITNIEAASSQRTFRSILSAHGNIHTFVTISGTAYYVYMGRTTQDLTVKFVEFHITGAGAGTDTKEVGLFSTPAAPNKSAQTLTKIAATGTVDSGTTTGMKRNTASFAQAVAKGTHLWAAARFALATTQPTCGGLTGDMSQAMILTTTGGGALTGLTTAAGTVPAIGTATLAPDLSVTLD